MKIFFTERPISEENLKPFQTTTHIIQYPKEDIPDVHEFGRTELIQTIKDLKVDVLVVGFKFDINAEILGGGNFSDHKIKAVFTRTTGTDHIDLEWCKDVGIEVIPLVGSELGDVEAVPLLTLWAILELVRKRGRRELKGKTLGIIGYGRIGKILGSYAQNLGMRVAIDDKEYNGIGLEGLLENSDIVSLNISSTEENRNFFDREKFEMMKDGSYFLNSSRGWLVDESALKWALESGKLAGAWSDFPVGFSHENLLITNHIGGSTLESSLKTEKIIVGKLLEYLK